MHSYFQEVKKELAARIDSYRQLEEERHLGWQSNEVDQLWRIRNARLETQRKGPRGPGYEKYHDFYARTLPRIDASVFSRGDKTFLDCGCAPGGLVAFFIKDLGWSGVGASLDPENGGLGMRYHPPEDKFRFVNMSFTSQNFDSEMTSLYSNRVDFLNLGVVIGGHQIEDDETTSIQTLSVCRNSFLLMFEALKTGGDLMWIFSSTSAGAWLYFLDKLRSVFPGGISLFSTLVPSRSPVYALCRGFNPEAGRLWQAELRQMTHPGTDCFDKWNYKTWSEAEEVVSYLRTDLDSVWRKQRDCLKQIRTDASNLANAPEEAFTKLSGGQNKAIAKSSSRADVDDNWRR